MQACLLSWSSIISQGNLKTSHTSISIVTYTRVHSHLHAYTDICRAIHALHALGPCSSAAMLRSFDQCAVSADTVRSVKNEHRHARIQPHTCYAVLQCSHAETHCTGPFEVKVLHHICQSKPPHYKMAVTFAHRAPLSCSPLAAGLCQGLKSLCHANYKLLQHPLDVCALVHTMYMLHTGSTSPLSLKRCHTGAIDALKLLDKHIAPGCILLFDDLVNYPQYQEYELKALWEWLVSTGRQIQVPGRALFECMSSCSC